MTGTALPAPSADNRAPIETQPMHSPRRGRYYVAWRSTTNSALMGQGKTADQARADLLRQEKEHGS